MKIDDRNIKMWSTIGSRATFGIAALELAKKVENLIVCTCDVSTSAGLDRFRKLLPDKYLDLGIAEQNLIGVAAGLASEGYNVITTTFAPFQTMRCCEQIKVNLGYMKKKVTMVGIASGIYLIANLGPGPRDGLMTGCQKATNLPIAWVRVFLEIAVISIGYALGGTIGLATIIFAFGIGPAVSMGLYLIALISEE